MKFEVTVTNIEQTDLFAAAIAKRLRGGEAIELVGDVGAGKTTFVKALVAALESEDLVSSPTFTISNVYDSGRLPVYHFDFYRLGDNDQLIRHELAEIVDTDRAVTIMEWAQPVKSVLQQDPITVQIRTLDEQSRNFTVTIPVHYAYVGGDA